MEYRSLLRSLQLAFLKSAGFYPGLSLFAEIYGSILPMEFSLFRYL